MQSGRSKVDYRWPEISQKIISKFKSMLGNCFMLQVKKNVLLC